ncbi:DUF6056 family protein [Butyrivibrio sp. FC2001]|uniref:DUF6056 family protein n=1 Tax=Butyrivibrio sp. FC2001 TaxID=1280671 RepID=UPI0004130E67|nr:DUF6056 family protein [Butyrivibrio sp. FC2001]
MRDNKRISSERAVCISLFILFFALNIILHKAVFFYHDDYGYASLKYGYQGNLNGMHWTLADLWGFIKWHYTSWGGRVLYFAVFILTMSVGEWFTQLFQACVYFLINVMIYKCIARTKYDPVALVSVMICWFSIGIYIARDGLFWYTASAIYVWPFLAFFSAVYILEYSKKKRYPLAGLLLFAAGFSQEQVAVLVGCYCAFKVLEELLIGSKMVYPYLCGIFGAIVLIAAPGNWIRVGENGDFYKLGLMAKVKRNLPELLSLNLGDRSIIRICLYVVVLLVISWIYYRRTLVKVVSVLVSCGLFAALGLKGKNAVLGLRLCFVLWLIWVILYYLYKEKKRTMMYIFVGAIASQAMMIMSPVLSPRIAIPFIIGVNFVLGGLLTELYSHSENGSHVLSVSVIGFLLILSLGNALYITRGYYLNYEANVEDRKILAETRDAIQRGEEVNSVVLHKLEDDTFANDMPYTKDYIKYWMKEYYEIPQSVEFIWR